MPFLRPGRHLKWAALLVLALAVLPPPAEPAHGAGQTISEIETVGSLGPAALQLDEAGNPVIAYTAQTDNSFRVKLLHCDDPNCAGGNDIPITVASTGNVGVGSDGLELDAAGNPVIVYYKQSTAGMNIMHCNDPDCAGGDESVTAPGPSWGDIAVELDAAGNPVISDYYSGLRVTHCNDPYCAGSDEFASIADTTALVGVYSSIELDAAGNPVVSYQDFGNYDLRLLRCNDPNCVGGDDSIAAPDTANDVGYSSSLVLDADGNPVIVHRDDTNDDLRFVHCNDPSCAGSDELLASPDGAPDATGSSASVDLDSLGRPIVSYSDSGLGLKVLRCGNVDCTANNSIVVAAEGASGGALQLDSLDRPIVVHAEGSGPGHTLRVLHCADVACAGNYDTDGDACQDIRESQLKSGSELSGGRRNTKNPHDYFNPTGDGQNRVDDILAVVDAYYLDDTDGNPGLPPYAPGYNPDTDRSLLGPDAWDTGPPNGLQRVDDILNIVKQYFHDCA